MENEESKKKTALVKRIRKQGGFAKRIEDAYSVGFPDLVIIIPNGPVFFAEGKIIRGGFFAPTPRQGLELERIDISSGIAVPCLVGFDGEKLYLHTRADRAKIDGCLLKRDDELEIDFFKRFYNERIVPNVR